MTDLLYLDYNCFQKGFDDLTQTRIKMEAIACQEIFTQAERNKVTLIWSFMHQDETLLCPFPQRKYAVLNMANICQVKIPPKIELEDKAMNKTTMTDTEVTIKGIEALQKSLGSAATWRFLSLIHGDATDYVKISQQLYQDQSIDEIYNRAKENWKD